MKGQGYNVQMLRSMQQNMPTVSDPKLGQKEYNYKMPAVASQSKIVPTGLPPSTSQQS